MDLAHALPAFVAAAPSLLSPPTCAACDAPVRSTSAFCGPCAATVEPSADPLTLGLYGGALATAIQRLKFGDRPDVARSLGDLLGDKVAKVGFTQLHVDWVVPVPLSPARLAERGYNQAQLLAARVASRARLPLRSLLLMRVRDTAAQAKLGRDARQANVDGAFACDARGVHRRRVLLVDDVRTTGATLASAARAIVDAGGTVVGAAVLAEADVDGAVTSPRGS